MFHKVLAWVSNIMLGMVLDKNHVYPRLGQLLLGKKWMKEEAERGRKPVKMATKFCLQCIRAVLILVVGNLMKMICAMLRQMC